MQLWTLVPCLTMQLSRPAVLSCTILPAVGLGGGVLLHISFPGPTPPGIDVGPTAGPFWGQVGQHGWQEEERESRSPRPRISLSSRPNQRQCAFNPRPTVLTIAHRTTMVVVVTRAAVLECCSSTAFADKLATPEAYEDLEEIIGAARDIWWNQTPVAGWLEAFAAHPLIGDMETLKRKYGAFAEMSKGEQGAAAATATEETLQELSVWNREYLERFGHIFIICASGKSADEMLDAIKARCANDPVTELTNAAVEQMKITELRLRKTFGGGEAGGAQAERRAGQILAHLAPVPEGARSPITTHVLDTCLGRPAAEVAIKLQRQAPGSSSAWETVAASRTNKDGRIPDLLPPSNYVEPGVYRVTFDTTEYMQRCKAAHPTFFPDKPFYPSVTVNFQILPSQANEHFHVPLTWNPFGYSTYRGS